ncbi:MAG TPA: substrate-binding domain-containing protein [Bacteroidales bacterium]|nr:substrate-binding domain-containing protein [Bacteroidales bacterium]HQJ81539.1 substrate-binding domain-containing protein [Bacteroidales bacterium]
MKKITVLLLAFAIIFGCKPRKSGTPGSMSVYSAEKNVSGSFTISGAYALTAILKNWAQDFMSIHQDVKIEILEKGTGQGIVDLIDGKADLAMISRPLTDEEKEAGIWMMPVAKDGVAIIVNDNNPYLPRLLKQGLSPDEIQKLFTAVPSPAWGELLDTTGSARAVVYTRADESGAAELLAGFCFRKPIDLKGTEVTGDEEMITRVRNNIFSAGFCNLSYAFNKVTGERIENIQIVPFDLDYDNKIGKIEKPFSDIETAHRSVWLGIYPESLCRDLTLGSVGKPDDPAILAFLDYVIHDGQKIVKEAGLCELNNVALRFARESLK